MIQVSNSSRGLVQGKILFLSYPIGFRLLSPVHPILGSSFMSLPFLIALGLLVIQAHSTSLVLHHRLYHPSLPPPPYSIRATIDTNGPHIYHSAISANVLSAPDHFLYQVALEREGDVDPNHWLVSSVKACHLHSQTQDSIVLHFSSEREIYNLDYFVSPVPHDGSCPEPMAGARTLLTPANSTIHLRHARLPPSPDLRLPPPLTPQGQVVTPEPEQGFIQKYWVYMVGALLVMMLAPAPAEEVAGPSQSGPAKK